MLAEPHCPLRGCVCMGSTVHPQLTHPGFLSAACLFRVNALSLVYLLYLLLLPWFQGPTERTIRGKACAGPVHPSVRAS